MLPTAGPQPDQSLAPDSIQVSVGSKDLNTQIPKSSSAISQDAPSQEAGLDVELSGLKVDIPNWNAGIQEAM